MQMFLCFNATIKDIPISADSHHVELRGKQIALFKQKTGFGYRFFFICPVCGKRVSELLLPTYSNKVCCQYCSGYHLRKYSERTNLDDQAPTELIDYYIGKIEDKLGVCYRPGAPFDYADYEPKRPKGMHTTTYKRELARLDTLYLMRDDAIAKGRGPTAKLIKHCLSAKFCDMFWLMQDTIKE